MVAEGASGVFIVYAKVDPAVEADLVPGRLQNRWLAEVDSRGGVATLACEP